MVQIGVNDIDLLLLLLLRIILLLLFGKFFLQVLQPDGASTKSSSPFSHYLLIIIIIIFITGAGVAGLGAGGGAGAGEGIERRVVDKRK